MHHAVSIGVRSPDEGVRVVGVDASEHGVVRVVHSLPLSVGVGMHRQEVPRGGIGFQRGHVSRRGLERGKHKP